MLSFTSIHHTLARAAGCLLLATAVTTAPHAQPATPPTSVAAPEFPVCPGGGKPDMPPTAFATLPEAMRGSFARQSAETRRDILCGQYLNVLLTDDRFIGALDEPRQRKFALDEITALLRAGQSPRTPEGRLNWLKAARHLLDRNQPSEDCARCSYRYNDDGSIDVPFKQEFQNLFESAMLPKLARADVDKEQNVDLQQFLTTAIAQPDRLALKTLRHMKAIGLLPPPADMSSPHIREYIVQAAYAPTVSDEVFALVAGAFTPYDAGGRALLLDAIESWSPTGMRRLLATGADPLAEGVAELAVARQLPELHALLRQAAVRRGTKLPDYVDQQALKPGFESAYTCHPVAAPGQPTQGKGSHGCHYVLRDPATGKPLPRTPYQLFVMGMVANGWVHAPINHAGVTDGAGRTPHFLVAADVELRAKRFVRVVGKGPHGASFDLEVDDSGHLGFDRQYMSSHSEGHAAPNRKYQLIGCRDAVAYEGVTDPMGHSVQYQSPMKCAFRAKVLPATP